MSMYPCRNCGSRGRLIVALGILFVVLCVITGHKLACKHNEEEAVAELRRSSLVFEVYYGEPVYGNENWVMRKVRKAADIFIGEEFVFPLNALYVYHGRVDRQTADLILHLQNVEYIYLSSCVVDDEALDQLATHPELRRVELSDASVSDAAVDRFVRRRRDVDVIR